MDMPGEDLALVSTGAVVESKQAAYVCWVPKKRCWGWALQYASCSSDRGRRGT